MVDTAIVGGIPGEAESVSVLAEPFERVSNRSPRPESWPCPWPGPFVEMPLRPGVPGSDRGMTGAEADAYRAGMEAAAKIAARNQHATPNDIAAAIRADAKERRL